MSTLVRSVNHSRRVTIDVTHNTPNFLEMLKPRAISEGFTWSDPVRVGMRYHLRLYYGYAEIFQEDMRQFVERYDLRVIEETVIDGEYDVWVPYGYIANNTFMRGGG